MKSDIIGRKSEKKILEKLLYSKEAEFLAIYGRRRIGKTFLIRNFYEKENFYLELTGQKDASLALQLKNFSDTFNRDILNRKKLAVPESWNEALRIITDEIDRRKPVGKVIIFIDELPWLASRKSDFLQALDYFWNSWASKKKNIIIIICGSASSWMINKILYNKGGLHNRVTARIRLLPFTLAESEIYLQSRNIHLERKQILDLYMCTGGVPHYLKAIERGLSAAQNIDKICFTKDGLLADEFNRLYVSLFDYSKNYIKVVRTLSKKRMGFMRNEILKSNMIESGGGATKILEALEESGFISRCVPFGKRANEAVYRLIDEYSLFYLTWIHNAPKQAFGITKSGYWQQKYNSRAWSAWSGYTFEGICQKHIQQIKQGLGINGISTRESSWFYSTSQNGEKGTQIDLLIDRADNCITICEMKYSDMEFVINKSYAEILRNKRNIFKNQTRTKKNVFIVMVTTHGTKKNNYYEELIDQQLTMDSLFVS